ncbi:MAG: oxygen-independent coproporphyrinogen III oxidase [Deltaproteobacteria bacterium]|nr:oxygen-independent coproporphyrinogen III oxidase [Deltaproteobacteria bacterium]
MECRIDNQRIELPAALIAKYDRPGPRYTSYPTAPAWQAPFDAADYAQALKESNTTARPLSLYVHLPFCEAHCTFCGCNVIITKKKALADEYLSDLEREIAIVAGGVDRGRPVVQLHWGGGTPTYLSPAQLSRLMAILRRHFALANDAEIGVEVDPRVTTNEQVAVLRELGFNRISMGIQDFHPAVQEAINRIQPVEMTSMLIDACRAARFASINVDLIYGLPHQTLERFAATLDAVIGLKPDRIALYNFAFVPWLKAQQRRIDPSTLPAPATKLALLLHGIDAFGTAGYAYIGMDHFARPTDELARARAVRTLWRNFQGYTTKAGTDLIAFGITGIGDVAGRYAQNVKTLAAYRRALAAGEMPIERGCKLTQDDLLRRVVIRELLCNNYLAVADCNAAFGIDFAEYFRTELEALRPLSDDGLVTCTEATIKVTVLGRLFARNIAMVFDRYLSATSNGRPLYSRTI